MHGLIKIIFIKNNRKKWLSPVLICLVFKAIDFYYSLLNRFAT